MDEWVLFEEDRWHVLKTVEDSDYAEIWHGCNVDEREHTYITIGDEKCDGCGAEVPEKVTTIATLYSKGESSKDLPYVDYPNVMKQCFIAAVKHPDFLKPKLTGVTNEDQKDE